MKWLGSFAVALFMLACAAPEANEPQFLPEAASAESSVVVNTPTPTTAPTPTPTPIPTPTATPIPTATPTATTPPQSPLLKEQTLRARAEEVAAAWGNWEQFYELVVADVPEFKEACTFPEFFAQITLLQKLIKAFIFVEGTAEFELRVVDVRATGNRGLVETEFFIDGLPMGEHLKKQGWAVGSGTRDRQEWTLTEGQWQYKTGTYWNPSEGCPKTGI